MTTARQAAATPAPALALVVIAPEALAELVTGAVATALEGATTSGPQPLLDRAALGKALGVSTSTVDRLVLRGLPHLVVGDAKRFERDPVLAWLRSQEGVP